jgi:hypothetical protein
VKKIYTDAYFVVCLQFQIDGIVKRRCHKQGGEVGLLGSICSEVETRYEMLEATRLILFDGRAKPAAKKQVISTEPLDGSFAQAQDYEREAKEEIKKITGEFSRD